MVCVAARLRPLMAAFGLAFAAAGSALASEPTPSPLAPTTIDTKLVYILPGGSTPTTIDNGTTNTFPGEAPVYFRNHLSIGTFFNADAVAETRPSVFLTDSVTTGDTTVSATAESSYTYQFMVTGLTGALVPIVLDASLSTSVSDDNAPNHEAFAQAALGITQADSGLDQVFTACVVVGGTSDCAAASQTISQTLWVEAGDAVTVTERGFVQASRGGSGTAKADPMFSIDPQFLDLNPGVGLEFGPGAANVQGAIPEPSTWALMTLGVFGLGGLLRRRRLAAA